MRAIALLVGMSAIGAVALGFWAVRDQPEADRPETDSLSTPTSAIVSDPTVEQNAAIARFLETRESERRAAAARFPVATRALRQALARLDSDDITAWIGSPPGDRFPEGPANPTPDSVVHAVVPLAGVDPVEIAYQEFRLLMIGSATRRIARPQVDPPLLTAPRLGESQRNEVIGSLVATGVLPDGTRVELSAGLGGRSERSAPLANESTTRQRITKEAKRLGLELNDVRLINIDGPAVAIDVSTDDPVETLRNFSAPLYRLTGIGDVSFQGYFFVVRDARSGELAGYTFSDPDSGGNTYNNPDVVPGIRG